MARKLRVEYPGAIYHVLNRGDRREPIFQDDPDRRCFLETLAEACATTGLERWGIGATPESGWGEAENCPATARGDDDDLGLDSRAPGDGHPGLGGRHAAQR
jgi:hypothetical protein